MAAVAIAILVIWIAFWTYWLIGAASAKRGRQRWGQFLVFRIAIILIILLLLRLKVFKGHNAFSHNPWWLTGIGLAMFLLGLALALWARVYLGTNWGFPMAKKEDPELVTTGPYRRVRHPIYSGIILGIAGTALALSFYWLIVAAVFGAYFLYSAITEERYMSGLFPDAYPAYKHSTKMLIPFVL